jgi:hypothetical protein
MRHKFNTSVILVGLALIIALALAWPAVPVQAGPELPPRNPLPTQPPPAHDDDGRPVGAYIELYAPGAPAGAWAVVQWQDSAGGWHDVEGWQGALPDSARWWVHPKDFGTGPLRWLVKDGPEGAVVRVSEPFHLPGQPDQTVRRQVILHSSRLQKHTLQPHPFS